MPRKSKDIKIITLDTETYGFEGGLKRIAMYDGEEVIFGYTFTDLIPQLDEWYKDFKLEIYIHNLDFDARKIPEVWQKGNIKWTKTRVINNKYALIACNDYNIHDSFKILPQSLDKLSKGFEVTHAKKDLMSDVKNAYGDKFKDKEDFFINCDREDPIYLEYLKYDFSSFQAVFLSPAWLFCSFIYLFRRKGNWHNRCIFETMRVNDRIQLILII